MEWQNGPCRFNHIFVKTIYFTTDTSYQSAFNEISVKTECYDDVIISRGLHEEARVMIMSGLVVKNYKFYGIKSKRTLTFCPKRIIRAAVPSLKTNRIHYYGVECVFLRKSENGKKNIRRRVFWRKKRFVSIATENVYFQELIELPKKFHRARRHNK